MRDEAFKMWMLSSGRMGKRPISDALSRCRRIEYGFSTDLDEEYLRDRGRLILEKLCYSSDDEKRRKPVPSELDFSPGANLKNGMASLKAAAKKYFEFCDKTK